MPDHTESSWDPSSGNPPDELHIGVEHWNEIPAATDDRPADDQPEKPKLPRPARPKSPWRRVHEDLTPDNPPDLESERAVTRASAEAKAHRLTRKERDDLTASRIRAMKREDESSTEARKRLERASDQTADPGLEMNEEDGQLNQPEKQPRPPEIDEVTKCIATLNKKTDRVARLVLQPNGKMVLLLVRRASYDALTHDEDAS